MPAAFSLKGVDDTRCRPVRRTGRVQESTGYVWWLHTPELSTPSHSPRHPQIHSRAGAVLTSGVDHHVMVVHPFLIVMLALSLTTAASTVPRTPAPEPIPWPAPGTWCAPPSCSPSGNAVRAFDLPEHDWLPGHRGVDLEGTPGEHVGAPATGVVTFAGPVGNRPLIVITHDDGRRTTLEPVTPLVAQGASVQRGEPVGILEAEGAHCPRCLHWGVREGDSYVDPFELLDGGPIVLLPRQP